MRDKLDEHKEEGGNDDPDEEGYDKSGYRAARHKHSGIVGHAAQSRGGCGCLITDNCGEDSIYRSIECRQFEELRAGGIGEELFGVQ